MFYGLNKFIKNLLPKRLFYRALLIVAIPVILIQLTITIVFFDSLWIKTNKGMTRALVGEIQTFIEVYSDDNFEKNNVTNIFSLSYASIKNLISPTSALVIPLLVLIQRLSKNTIDMITCNIIIGVATINNAL